MPGAVAGVPALLHGTGRDGTGLRSHGSHPETEVQAAGNRVKTGREATSWRGCLGPTSALLGPLPWTFPLCVPSIPILSLMARFRGLSPAVQTLLMDAPVCSFTTHAHGNSLGEHVQEKDPKCQQRHMTRFSQCHGRKTWLHRPLTPSPGLTWLTETGRPRQSFSASLRASGGHETHFQSVTLGPKPTMNPSRTFLLSR